MNKNFFGRKMELDSLEAAYKKDSFQMCILYGRRRVGKTALINEFIKGKDHIFFTAIKGSLSRNIELLGESVINYFYPGSTGLHIADFQAILSTITKMTGDKKLVLVIDELPYLAETDESLLSLLQKEIDRYWLDKNIFLILCGSSISFMLDEVLSDKSPLYGRRTMQIQLKPFDYMETAAFVPGYSAEEKAISYGVTGGIAKYISLFDPNKTLDDNIIDLYFSPSGFLYEEPHNLLVQEFRNAPVYEDVISTIASGATRAVEIKDKTGLENASVHNVLTHLIETKIVTRNLCITDENNKKKIQYTLSDGMFLFWYRFIPSAISQIEIGNGREYYLNVVKPKLHAYMGSIFEEMCRQYLLANSFTNPDTPMITEVGKWFGTNPKSKEQTDIDVVGINRLSNTAVIGECKFKNEILDKTVLDSLIARNGLLDKRYRVISYVLFSLSGFSEWIMKHAEEMNTKTVSLEQMYYPI